MSEGGAQVAGQAVHENALGLADELAGIQGSGQPAWC